MDTVRFLEQLAMQTHVDFNDLIDSQPKTVQAAFAKNDTQSLKKLVTSQEYLANTSHVVQE